MFTYNGVRFVFQIVTLVIMGTIATRHVATVMNQHNVLVSLEPVELDVKLDIQEDCARTVRVIFFLLNTSGNLGRILNFELF